VGEKVDAILLDNMSPEAVREAVRRFGGDVFLEASGGIHLGNVEEYARTGIAAISIGALTHSAPALDLSFELLW
jgi:nicotinate-nucleotide pyrophosphorylase (carboxylating)